MKITKEILKKLKGLNVGLYHEFVNSFNGIKVHNDATTIEVKNFDLFNHISWLMCVVNIGFNVIIYKDLKYQYKYDKNDNLIEYIDLNENKYQYEYDSNNNKIKTIYPNGDKYQFVYDENNNLIEEIYPDEDNYT